MKTDKIINGVLIRATQPKDEAAYVWHEGVVEIGSSAFYDRTHFNKKFSIPENVTEIGEHVFFGWNSFNSSNSRRVEATSEWLRIDGWFFAGCYSGILEQLKKRIDSGETTPKREKAFEEISKPF